MLLTLTLNVKLKKMFTLKNIPKARKKSHKDYLWDTIYDLRKDIANYVLKCRAKDKKINVKKLNHKAELIIKYSDKLRKFQTQPTLR
tara:strand:+ start:1873 stop:2133 length:261 start_codon:yes stop_codon:yes gene_type:complete